MNSEPIPVVSRRAVLGCALATLLLVVGFVLAWIDLTWFRADIAAQAVVPASGDASAAFVAAGVLVVGAGCALVAAVRESRRHPVVLVVAYTLLIPCLAMGLAEVFVGCQLLTPTWALL